MHNWNITLSDFVLLRKIRVLKLYPLLVFIFFHCCYHHSLWLFLLSFVAFKMMLEFFFSISFFSFFFLYLLESRLRDKKASIIAVPSRGLQFLSRQNLGTRHFLGWSFSKGISSNFDEFLKIIELR